VLVHPDDLVEVVGAAGHRRLADLERRQRRWALALLEHDHARLRPRLLELDRQRQTRQPAA
jgi:hypothetical protein